MKRKEKFWPIAMAVIYFAAGWTINDVWSKYATRAEAQSEFTRMETQAKRIVATREMRAKLWNAYRKLDADKEKVGEADFILSGRAQQQKDLGTLIIFINAYITEQERGYNDMARMADPSVFDSGLPEHIGIPNYGYANKEI